MASKPFRFKKFDILQEGAAHAVGTDAVLLGAWADTSAASTILDIGTGTGIIALMLAQRCETAKITALEIQAESAKMAAGNVKSSPWSDRIEVLQIAVQDFTTADGAYYDLIVSNPPFFSEKTVSPDASRRLGRHTASLDPDDLLAGVQRLLAPGGRFCLILPEKEGNRFCERAALGGLYCTKIMEVRARPEKPVERLLIQLERDPKAFERSSLTICTAIGIYALEYQLLTKDFYLDF